MPFCEPFAETDGIAPGLAFHLVWLVTRIGDSAAARLELYVLLSYSLSDSGGILPDAEILYEALSLSLSLLTGLVGVPASVSAAPILYNIHFTTNGIGLFGIGPSSGSFLYDSATTRFASFNVQWNSLSFDLTSSANAPNVSGACDTVNPNSADFFSYLMSGYNGCRLNVWEAGELPSAVPGGLALFSIGDSDGAGNTAYISAGSPPWRHWGVGLDILRSLPRRPWYPSLPL